ncbi:MAG: fumarylacetoacetate hydrolase family protein [bacterium]|nr:fumarylacetoacetate hydrolase family protein [bacterium]
MGLEYYARIRTNYGPAYARLTDMRCEILSGAPWDGAALVVAEGEAAGLELLAPCEPHKIICVGVNYHDHAQELGHSIPASPLLFLKPPTSVIGPGEAIVYPPYWTQRVDYEAELAVVIGWRARRVKPEAAGEVIFGYTCLNDVTARDVQRQDGQWTRAKSFDTFCPLGPVIARGVDPSALRIECRLNGQVRQSSSTARMIFGVRELVSFASHVMTLEPGDVLATGTPAGVGPMQPGDVVEVEIEGIGCLRNSVVAGV